jgi:phosphatidate cytidylyltransferase
MNNFIKRSLFGAIYVGIVIGLLWYGELGFMLLMFIIGVLGIKEFLQLQNAFEWPVFITLCLIHAIFLSTHLRLQPSDDYTANHRLWIAALVSMVHVIWSIKKYGTQVWDILSVHVFSIVYITLPLFLFSTVSVWSEYHFLLPLLGFILVWGSDTFAYLCGKLLGRNPLYPSLSPGKTIEGFVGGILLNSILGAVLVVYWDITLTWLWGLMLGAAVAITGTAGDLFQSALKRKAGVKDSGNIIPGHGGILDRFDAFLFAAVIFWIWYHLLSIYGN